MSTSVTAPIELHTLDKGFRRGLNDLVERVTMKAVIDGDGRDLMLRVYLAGLYHGSECAKRTQAQGQQNEGAES